MGKIKSAILTAIIVAAVAVLAFFAVVSFPVAGSGGVKKYNSFISSIHLGSDFTGEARTVLYPEGVRSEADYLSDMPEIPQGEAAEGLTQAEIDEYTKKQTDYVAKYEKRGSLYIEKDLLGDSEAEFIENVKKDAEVLNDRFNQKGYSNYSVSVQDKFTVRICVPTNFAYSAYKDSDDANRTARSEETAKISRTVQYLTASGELTLRNSDIGKGNDDLLVPDTADITTYFKSFKKYSSAKRYAVKVNLTKEGKELFSDKTDDIVNNASSDKAVHFYVGDTQLISLTVEEAISEKSFYITVNDGDYADDYAIILNSVSHGKTLSLDYGEAGDIEIVYSTASLGKNAAIYFGVILLLIIVGAIVFSVVRYKKLGLVNALTVIIFALAMVVALLIIGIQLTAAGAFAAVLGLALLCGSNIAAFEAIRKETKKGKTMQSAVKSGYKSVLTAILDLHVILIIASLLLTLICVGEIQACGFIFFIASIASYILYWFTRFMWFVISSPARDKFKFCGFKREVPLDD